MFVCTEYLAHFGPFFNTYCAPFALIFFFYVVIPQD